MDIDNDGNIDIIYINNTQHLIINKILKNKELKSGIIKDIKTNILELSLVDTKGSQNIFYIEATESKQIFKIFHINIEGDNIQEFLVDEIEIYKIINPLRIIRNGQNLIIAYYFKNQICIKGFDTKNKLWSPSIILTDNQNKLYIDIMKINDTMHLVYSDYIEENFIIKYERLLFEDNYISKQKQISLSNSGNNTDPIIIKIGDQLWVCWRNSNQLLSIYSLDDGLSWSDIYIWKNTKNMDIVKYKYLTNIFDDRIIIEYAYGSIKKDIRFIGFGDLKDAEVLQILR